MTRSVPKMRFTHDFMVNETTYKMRIQHLLDCRNQSDEIINKQVQKIDQIKKNLRTESQMREIESEFRQIK